MSSTNHQGIIALAFLLTLLTLESIAQSTVGLISLDPNRSYPGYNLIYPHNQPNVYLINSCGEVVHDWIDSSVFVPGNTAYLLENGNLVKTKRHRDVTNDAIWAGGGGDIVEIRNWENELLWQYQINSDTQRLHHDIEVMPNGNILMVLWDLKDQNESIAAGRNPAFLPQEEIWSETVIEVDPATNEIVWKWEAWDHLIQDFDQSKENYGVISDRPRRIDINRFINGGSADWLHVNSIDYHPSLDHIMLSVPFLDEIWVIDHSTSTEQAKGSFGGKSNHGGDLIYRIGNNYNFKRGDSSDQILFFQHDAHWALDHLSPVHPDYGKIVCFNNRVSDTYSTVEKWRSSWDMYNVDYDMQMGVWPPTELTETISHPQKEKIYSSGLSSAQILPNGNTLVCAGRTGYLVELTSANEVVWEYKVPLRRGQPVAQGEMLNLNDNLTFRLDRYPEDFLAFRDKELDGKYFIENDPDTDFCNRILSTMPVSRENLILRPNPAHAFLHVGWEGAPRTKFYIYGTDGVIQQVGFISAGKEYIELNSLQPGLYIVKTESGTTATFVKI